MEPEGDKIDIAEELKARFLQLPKALQKAITSADVEHRLRALADSHQLHLDLWQKLENEVMLALYGFQKLERLEENIKKELGVSAEVASALAGDIAGSIFQPIREELERELEHPDAKVKEESGVDEMRSEVLAGKPEASGQEPVTNNQNPASTMPATSYGLQAAGSPLPSTPPPPPNTEKSIRAPMSATYASQAPSHERLAANGDPYREPIG